MRKNIITISAPSGSGKTTLCKALLTSNKSIKLSVSYTTRSPRDNESNGSDYFFISENIFKKKIKTFLGDQYKFIENNNIYNIKKLRQTSGQDFIFDLFAMSKSNLIISSTGGNVPYTSNLISGFKQNYIKWPQYKLKYLLYHKIRVLIFYLRKIFKLF